MTLNTRGMFGTFYLNEVEFALPIDQIQEVVNYPEKITPMPLNNNFLLGIFNLREAAKLAAIKLNIEYTELYNNQGRLIKVII